MSDFVEIPKENREDEKDVSTIPVDDVEPIATTTVPVYSENLLSQENAATNEKNNNNEEEDEEGPTSSIENIIPLQKLKSGWFTISAALRNTAQKVSDTAVDAYHSESFQAVKNKTAEVVIPAWEKTCEVAAPIWEQTKQTAEVYYEKTKETAGVAYEKTKENVVIAAENARPTLQRYSSEVGTAAVEGWKKVSEVTVSAVEYTTEHVARYTNGTDNHDGAGNTGTAESIDTNNSNNSDTNQTKPFTV